MKGLRRGIISLLFACMAVTASAQDGDKILGVYRALGQDTNLWSDVKFTKAGDKYYAQVVWLEKTVDENGNPLLDAKNPDPELRKLPANRIRVIWDIVYDAKKDMWSKGKIYNPMDGKTYDVQVSFDKPDTIKIRAYVGTPMLGRTFFWTKKK